MFIKTDKSAEMFYAEHLEESEKLQEVVSKGKAHHYAYEDISQDIFTMLYEPRPEDETADIPVGLRICKQALDKVKELREYQELHRLTQLDGLASGIAACSMGEAFMQFVPKVPESPEQLREKAASATELGMDAQAGEANAAADKVQAYLDKIHNRQLDDEVCRQKVRAALQKAVEETREAMDGMSAFGYGDDAGQLKQSGLKEKLELTKKLRSSKKLAQIAKIAGRFITIAKKKQREKMVSHSVNGVKVGADISHTLPEELAMLADDDMDVLFYKAFAEESLLEYDLQNKVPQGQGPIIYQMDGSASMGEGCFPELAAKAVGMALAEIAKMQRRDFVMGQFGSADQYRELVILSNGTMLVEDGKGGKTEKPYSVLQLMAELEWFFAGGTNFQRPLQESIKHISGHKFNRADIIFATDGEAAITPEFEAEYNAVKKAKSFSCIGVLIGYSSKVMEKFCDEVFEVDSLLDNGTKNEALNEKMFKI